MVVFYVQRKHKSWPIHLIVTQNALSPFRGYNVAFQQHYHPGDEKNNKEKELNTSITFATLSLVNASKAEK